MRFHHKAFQAIKLLAYPRRLSLSRIYPILWRKLWPLHASALLHWLLWLSLDFSTSSKYPFQRFHASKHLFSESEKNVAVFFFFNFRTLLASFHAASRACRSGHSVPSWDRSSNFGALELRWWNSPGHFRMRAWRARLSWILLHVRSVSVCLSSCVISMKTSAAAHPGIRNPIFVYLMNRIQRISPFDRMAHASSTWPLHFCHHSFYTLFLGCSSTWRCA